VLVIEPARFDVGQRRGKRQLLRLRIRDQLGIDRLIDRVVEEVGHAQIGQLVQAGDVGDVRCDRYPLLLSLVDDRGDHLRRKHRVGHPDLDEVDLLRFQVPDVRTRFVGRRRLERRRAWIRTAHVETLTGGVSTRRKERLASGLSKERNRFRLVVSRRSHRRHAPPQLRDPVPLHVLRWLVDMAVHIDQSRQEDFAASVHALDAVRNGNARPRSRAANPIAFHDDHRIVEGRTAGAVDEARADNRDRAGCARRWLLA
jgi:hypothetical protein